MRIILGEAFFYVLLIIITILVSFICLVAFAWILDLFVWKTCKAAYNDAQYSFWWGCKIKYNWEYIPKELYIKAFEQNLNINK